MKKYITILLLFISISLASQESIFILNYNTAAPLGNTSDYINQFSWRGISVEQRFFLDNNTTIGFLFAWQVFNKKLLNYTEEFENARIFGNQYRYLNAYPIMAIGHYHFAPEAYIRPYIGGGVGLYSMNRYTEMGLYGESTKSWHFGIAPEAGLWFDLSSTLNFNLSVKYNYAFKSSKSDAYPWLNINAGLIFVY